MPRGKPNWRALYLKKRWDCLRATVHGYSLEDRLKDALEEVDRAQKLREQDEDRHAAERMRLQHRIDELEGIVS